MLPSHFRINTRSIVRMMFVFSTFLMISSCRGPKLGDKCIPNGNAWFPVRYADMRVTCPQVVEKQPQQAQQEGKN